MKLSIFNISNDLLLAGYTSSLSTESSNDIYLDR